MTVLRRSSRLLALLLAVTLYLVACAATDIEDDPPPIGDFRLGHVVIKDGGALKAPVSRSVPEGLLREDLKAAIRDRLGRYKGEKWYHLAVAIGPYSLSAGGVPVIGSPRSAMIIEVTVWDDASESKLNDSPNVISVIEPSSVQTFIGSGLFRTPEEQSKTLATSAAYLIEYWLQSEQSPLPGVGDSN